MKKKYDPLAVASLIVIFLAVLLLLLDRCACVPYAKPTTEQINTCKAVCATAEAVACPVWNDKSEISNCLDLCLSALAGTVDPGVLGCMARAGDCEAISACLR